jgi:hypothetical protein
MRFRAPNPHLAVSAQPGDDPFCNPIMNKPAFEPIHQQSRSAPRAVWKVFYVGLTGAAYVEGPPT